MCYVTIFDGSGKPITVEVSREIYQVFADYDVNVKIKLIKFKIKLIEFYQFF